MIIEDYQENYQSGWVRSYRSIMQKGWYKKSEYFHLWHHLLYKANHKPNEWIHKNNVMKVDRGQFITSRKSLSDETGINESKVERILKCFENEQQIEQQNLYTSRLISILNYNNYQKGEQANEQQVNSKRTASEQQVNTNNNVKNEKNVRSKPPKLIDVIEYFDEKGYSKQLAEKFFNGYDVANWKDSKGRKIKSWKQKAIHVWFKPENKIKTNKEPFNTF